MGNPRDLGKSVADRAEVLPETGKPCTYAQCELTLQVLTSNGTLCVSKSRLKAQLREGNVAEGARGTIGQAEVFFPSTSHIILWSWPDTSPEGDLEMI